MANVTSTYTIGPAKGQSGASTTVEGKVEVSCVRTSATKATVTMTAYFHRLTYYAPGTSGTTVVSYYMNGSVVATQSVSIKCVDTTWIQHSSHSFDVDISDGALASKTLTSLGFSSTCSATANLTMAYTKLDKVVIPAYATPCGAPKFTLTDNGSGTVTVSVTKGANGTNNTTSTSKIYYSFTKSNLSTTNYDNTVSVNHASATTGTGTITYTSSNDVLYVIVEADATYDHKDSVSAVKSIVLSNLEPGANGAPTVVICTPVEHTSQIEVQWSGATAGTNNSISGYTFQYAASNTLTFNNWVSSTKVTSTGTSGETTFNFSNDYRYYALRCKALSSVDAAYDSDWSAYTAVSNANYETGARVKNSGEWASHVAHIYKDGEWLQSNTVVTGVITPVYVSDGSALIGNDGEQIYSLEYTI